MSFKLRDWIGLINWTHLLQSETHVQYFDSFVCSGVIKVKISSLIYSTFSGFFLQFNTFVFSGEKPIQFAFYLIEQRLIRTL